MTKQTHCLLTICLPMPVDPDFGFARESDVEQLIGGLGNPAQPYLVSRLNATGIIHFISLHVIRTTKPDEPSYLLLEASADGEIKYVIAALCEAIGEELMVICRRAYGGVENLDELNRLLHKHNCELSQSFFPLRGTIGLPFIGLDGLTVERIQMEQRVVEEAQKSLQVQAASALDYVNRAKDHVNKAIPHWRAGYGKTPKDDLTFVDSDDAPWLTQRVDPTVAGYLRLVPELRIAVIAFVAIITLLTFGYFTIGFNPATLLIGLALAFSISVPFALSLLAWVGYSAYSELRKSEQRNKPNDLDPDPAVIRELLVRENDGSSVQNHMVSVTEVIPEFFRRNITLPFAMRTIRTTLEQGLFRRGFLADIGTIHFARWVLLPGTNKLVFVSNYNGSWESYLEDFITKASHGLTGVWSNCVGFPQTKRLFMDGASDGDRFKRWARRSMIPTRFWYSAYPKLTAQQIRANAMICDGLLKVTSATDAEAWLELFDSIPRPEANLEYDEIQRLVLRGIGELPEARCLAVRFMKKGAPSMGRASEWIGDLLKSQSIVFADQGSKTYEQAAFLALSATGMEKLGVEEAALRGPDSKHSARANFPPPFVLDMEDLSRNRILSDDPVADKWTWGAGEERADAVLLLYGRHDHIDAFAAKELARISAFDLECFHIVKLDPYGVNKNTPIPGGRKARITKDEEESIFFETEPFGYVDGVSQPITYKSGSSITNPLHDVEAGEFVLGYRDGRGYFPPTLLLPSLKDPDNFLPGPPSQLPKRWPQFRRAQDKHESTRDLGRNGSFLVIRELEQDVAGFEKWLIEVAAKKEGVAPAKVTTPQIERAAATVMGRWRNGVSIVNAPVHQSKDPPDNEFLYGRDDPQGHRCPFGAHIRRANPRDSLNPLGPEEINIANRHRILRRGRPYTEYDGEKAVKARGMLFMCFNADIERQFEFVQQNWINASSHHGLRGEHDPVASHVGGGKFTMPSQVGPPKDVVRPAKAFVAVRGGGYFFMPSRSALRYLASLKPAAPPAAASNTGGAQASSPMTPQVGAPATTGP